jgi:hypothetical protein
LISPDSNRRFGVLLDETVHDTLIASRVARAGEWERKKGRVTQISHSLELAPIGTQCVC